MQGCTKGQKSGGAGSNVARRRCPAAPSDLPKSGGAAAPADYGRSEGAAGQRRRPALLPATPDFWPLVHPCNVIRDIRTYTYLLDLWIRSSLSKLGSGKGQQVQISSYLVTVKNVIYIANLSFFSFSKILIPVVKYLILCYFRYYFNIAIDKQVYIFFKLKKSNNFS